MNNKIRVSSRAIILHDGKILLTEFGGGKYYNFTGGGIEENETAKQAVVREVMEESGLSVDVGELVFSLEYEPKSCHDLNSRHHISFFFRCYLNAAIPPQPPSHPDTNPDDASISSVVKWIDIAELSQINLVPPIHEPLMRYIETGVFSPSFWAACEHL